MSTLKTSSICNPKNDDLGNVHAKKKNPTVWIVNTLSLKSSRFSVFSSHLTSIEPVIIALLCTSVIYQVEIWDKLWKILKSAGCRG